MLKKKITPAFGKMGLLEETKSRVVIRLSQASTLALPCMCDLGQDVDPSHHMLLPYKTEGENNTYFVVSWGSLTIHVKT